jgi:hypothetical protein
MAYTTYDSSINASTEVTLQSYTAEVEVSAIDKGILMRWGTTDVSTSAFDHFIPANTTKKFYVPRGTTAVNFIEEAATGKLVLREI